MSSTMTPYLERLKEGLRQVRPPHIDDLWTTTPPPPAPLSNNTTTAAATAAASTTASTSSSSRPWGMDNNMGHLLAENLDWWCTREEMLQLLLQNNDDDDASQKRLERLVHVMVTSAVWMNQWSSNNNSLHPEEEEQQQNNTSQDTSITTSGSSNTSNNIITSSCSKHNNTTVYVSHCVGCNHPFDASSSSAISTSISAPLLPSDVARRERIASDQNLELHLHLLITTMSVSCSLIRHNHNHDNGDATDRLIVLLSVDTPSSSIASSAGATATATASADPNVSSSSQLSSSLLLGPLPVWAEQQMRKDKPQAALPLIAIIQHCGGIFPKAAVVAAGLLSLITCHRPAVIFNTLLQQQQQHQQQYHLDMFMSSLYTYLDKVCLPLLLVKNNHNHNINHNGDENANTSSSSSSSSSCLVQERFGLVAFFNILPTLYHLASWKAARRHGHFHKIVVALVSCIINICHSATTTTTNNNNNDSCDNNDNNDMTHNDGPADLETLVELVGAKFTVLESLILSAQQPLRPVQQEQHDSSQQHSLASQTPATPSWVHDDDEDDDKWRMTILQQRPMSTAVAAGIEILSWWARHGVDLTKMDNGTQNNTNDDSTTTTLPPRIKMPRSSNGGTATAAAAAAALDDDNKQDGNDDNTTMMSISACLTKYLPRIAILTQRVAPRLGYMETMARSLALGVQKPPPHHHHQNDQVDTSTNSSSMASALFLEEAFSLVRERCGLPTCRRRQRAVVVISQEQQQGGGDTNGGSTCSTSNSTKALKVCHGGCKGLERYCCRDHQKEHWPIHRLFCKNNGSNNKSAS